MLIQSKEWYSIDDLSVTDTPALVIYSERVIKNISLAINMMDDPERLRPHVKTVKASEPIFLMKEAGINKFKCATITEAEMLGMCHVSDALLAYQPVGPKLERFIDIILNYQFTKFSCLVDNSKIASIISKEAIKKNIIITVFIDLNVGMNRTGVMPGQQALDLFHECKTMAGINVKGLHVYDGHIHDHSLVKRKEACDLAYQHVESTVKSLAEKGYTEILVIAGGTPTFPIHLKRPNIECSPGTFIYWDGGYEEAFREQPFLTAALVLTRVISLPSSGLLCVDLGYKAVASEGELKERVSFLNAPELEIISQSEEHLVVWAGLEHAFQIGDVLYGLPKHICPTVALYERAIIIENSKIQAEWMTIARDRIILS